MSARLLWWKSVQRVRSSRFFSTGPPKQVARACLLSQQNNGSSQSLPDRVDTQGGQQPDPLRAPTGRDDPRAVRRQHTSRDGGGDWMSGPAAWSQRDDRDCLLIGSSKVRMMSYSFLCSIGTQGFKMREGMLRIFLARRLLQVFLVPVSNAPRMVLTASMARPCRSRTRESACRVKRWLS